MKKNQIETSYKNPTNSGILTMSAIVCVILYGVTTLTHDLLSQVIVEGQEMVLSASLLVGATAAFTTVYMIRRTAHRLRQLSVGKTK